jgi:hypothetical protein
MRRYEMDDDFDDKIWTRRVASIIIDTLIRAKIVSRDDFSRAVAITEEEIHARLAIEDRPQPRRQNSN